PREPPHHGSSDCAGPEASWGHRNSSLPGPKGEMFSGCYFPAATMTRDEDGPPVPELTRRITLSPCHAGPVRALTPVITRTPRNGIPPGGILAGSGYACRAADAPALPPPPPPAPPAPDPRPRRHHRHRQPLLPRPPRATAAPGAASPRRHSRRHRRARHPHRRARGLADCKPGRLTADDADGYHRVTCPAGPRKI